MKCTRSVLLDQRFLVGPVDTTCKDHMVSQGKSLVYKRYTYTHISITGVAIFWHTWLYLAMLRHNQLYSVILCYTLTYLPIQFAVLGYTLYSRIHTSLHPGHISTCRICQDTPYKNKYRKQTCQFESFQGVHVTCKEYSQLFFCEWFMMYFYLFLVWFTFLPSGHKPLPLPIPPHPG